MTNIYRAWRAPLFAALIVVFGFAGASPGAAADGPFSKFPGTWTGTGTIRLSTGKTERLRCTATYRLGDTAGRRMSITLGCKSDSYKFEFTGTVEAGDNNAITGRWNETTRNVGGTVLGRAYSNNVQLLAETSAFAADLLLTTSGDNQRATIKSRGGGETVQASITLRRSH